MTTIDEYAGPSQKAFEPHEEHGIVSLLIDYPELYSTVSEVLTADTFQTPEAKWVIAMLQQDYSKAGVLPSRSLLSARASRLLHPDVDHNWKDVIALIDRKSDPRDVPFIRERLHSQVERMIFRLLFDTPAHDAYYSGNYDYLRSIIEKADRLKSLDTTGFWLFEQIDELFLDQSVDHISTGFRGLDKVLNNGGPSRRETVVWMGPTGVGKSILLCNNACTCVRNGLNVLYVTFELSAKLTAIRILGPITGMPLNSFTLHNAGIMKGEELEQIKRNQESAKHKAMQFASKGQLVIYDLPPGECSVDNVHTIIDSLKKTRSWTPDVVILDYLELMASKRQSRDEDEYTGQKRISTEVRGLAKKENVLVFTATQSNRSSVRAKEANIDLDKSAESYGKNMPSDYVISINQTEEEYNSAPSKVRLWVAKNRNGPKFVTVESNIWYDRMIMTEVI